MKYELNERVRVVTGRMEAIGLVVEIDPAKTIPYLVETDGDLGTIWLGEEEVHPFEESNPNNDDETEAPRFLGSGEDIFTMPISEAISALAGDLAILVQRVKELEGDVPTPYGVCSRCWKDVFWNFKNSVWDHVVFPSDDPHTPPAIMPTEGPTP